MPKLQSRESKATRLAFGEMLVELGRENPDVVVMGADVSGSVRVDLFAKEFPERFFSVGIAEQDMMGVAAGLTIAGKVAFASAYGEFATGRPFDQIRQSIAYSKLPVKICASHCGITVGPDGATHQSLEDISIMRTLPHMTVATPCDYLEMRKMMRATMEWNHPIYLRFFRDNTPVFTDDSTPMVFGKANTLIEGKDVTVIACGLQVWEAILAEEDLAKEGISVRVLNMHTIKPIDREAIVKAATETGAIVTAEDHQRHGGLGSAVAEVLAETHPTPMEFVAVNDTFGESGPGADLMAKYGVDRDAIVKAVRKVIKRRK
jgi:transketolase